MADSFNIGLGSQAQAAFNIGEGKKVTKEQRLEEQFEKRKEQSENFEKSILWLEAAGNVNKNTPENIQKQIAEQGLEIVLKDKELKSELRRRETDLYYSENPEEAPENYRPIFGFDTESFKIGKGPAKQSVFNLGDSKPKVESGMATGVRNGDIFQENIAIQNKKLQETETELDSTKKDIDKNIDKSFTTFE